MTQGDTRSTGSPDPPLRTAKPSWLRLRMPTGAACEHVRSLIREGRLHTVCQEARCPNLWECFSRKTATFMILGATCTRDCRFCNVSPGRPSPPDAEEPKRLAEAVEQLALSYVVVTSVTRDDLADGGAGHFAATIRAIRQRRPAVGIEVLIPDFKGDGKALAHVLQAKPDVLNHNLETVPRLYPRVRPQAIYRRSLELLARARRIAPAIQTKSGLMLGLGEELSEVRGALVDLRAADCQILTLGQYLQPTPQHLPVEHYVPPEQFEALRVEALGMGFAEAACGPLVRSSYRAEEAFRRLPAEAAASPPRHRDVAQC